jgi:hypothetical protein
MGMAAGMKRKMKRIVSTCARLMRVLVQMLVVLLMKVQLLLLWLPPHQVDGLGRDVPACCFK